MQPEYVNSYFEGLSSSGPEWLIAGAVVIILGYLAYKVIPVLQQSKKVRDDAYVKKVESDIALEELREQRKSEESRARERRDIERSESEGRWIQLTEQMVHAVEESNQITKAVSISMNALQETIKESRDGSKRMQRQMSVVYAKIVNGDDDLKEKFLLEDKR